MGFPPGSGGFSNEPKHPRRTVWRRGEPDGGSRRSSRRSTGWLLAGGDPDEPAEALTPNEEAALSLVRALPAEQQLAAIAMLDGLVRFYSGGVGDHRHREDRRTMSLGKRIRSLRLERGETQAALAAAIGASRYHISKIETGDDQPGLSLLEAIAAHYGVPLDWLKRGLNEAPPLLVQDAEERELVLSFRQLDEEKSSLLLALLRTLSGSPGARACPVASLADAERLAREHSVEHRRRGSGA
jgi:transcriptional regulator with XRE-family HTH domain